MGIRKPHYDSFPAEVRALGADDWIALGNFLDQQEADLLEAIDAMGLFADIEKIAVELLPYLSFSLRAGIYRSDSDRIKRKKILEAIARHKIKGTEGHVFNAIKEVTGVMPTIYVGEYTWFAIWESKNDLMPYPNNFMKWDTKTAPEGGGFSWLAFQELPGALRAIIYIDLNIYPLSQRIIDKLVDIIHYFGAVYFRYYLGVLTPNGWVMYRQVY